MKQRIKPEGETWVRTLVPDRVHEALAILAIQRKVPLQSLVRELLAAAVAQPKNDSP